MARKTLIEKAEMDDLPAILALQYEAYQSEAALFDDPGIPPLRQTLSETEADYLQGIILKAVTEDGSIVGSVRACCDGGTTYIGKLMVHPSQQRQGIGTQLLHAIEAACPRDRYELFTSSKSRRNLRLYIRAGYRVFREEQITDELRFVYLEKKQSAGAEQHASRQLHL